MLSRDTKEDVFRVLLNCRYAKLLDMKIEDLGDGFEMKSFELMSDEEIVEEYRRAYNVDPKDDPLYDRMMADIAAHKMLTRE